MQQTLSLIKMTHIRAVAGIRLAKICRRWHQSSRWLLTQLNSRMTLKERKSSSYGYLWHTRYACASRSCESPHAIVSAQQIIWQEINK